MNDLLPFVVVGITTGSVYGLAAMGLVLTYKTSGIFNFAHGAIAAVAAFAFYELHTLRGLPWPIALVIAIVVLPPLMALVLERITVNLASGTATTKIVATIGLQLAIVSALVAHYGPAGIDFPEFLPAETVEIVGIFVGVDQLISAGVAAGAAVAYFLFFRISPMGVKMRAVVDDPALLSLAGTSPFAVRSWAWLIGTWFAALSGILLAPQIGLDAMLLTLLVVHAYGAAAVGLFSSLPMTYAGGLLIGILASLATNFLSGSDVLAGLPPAIPFLVLFVVLLLVPRSKLVETGVVRRAPLSGPVLSRSGKRVLVMAVIAVALTVPLVVGTKLPVYNTALVFVLIFFSLHLLVHTSGQVSLAHAGLVAVGAAAFAHLAVGAALPWLAAVLLAGVLAVPVGVIVAIPAIRLSGLFLALATYGFALLLEHVAYRSQWMFGPSNNLPAIRPALFEGDTAFYYVLLSFTVAGALLVAIIGRSRLGRLLRAMADSPTTLSTLGLAVNVTRVTVFGISAFIAGVAGALYASQGLSATGVPFTSYASLTWLAILVLNSGLRSGAPVAAAIGLAVVPAYINNATLIEWLPVAFGLGALAVCAHQAAVTERRSSMRNQPTQNRARSRAGERISGTGAARERVRAVEAARIASRHVGPARLRIRSSSKGVSG